MRGIYIAACMLGGMLGRAALADDELPPSGGFPAMMGGTWWSDPQVQNMLELANPFSHPVIPREPRYVDPYGWQFLQDPFRLGFTKHDEIVVLPAADLRGPGFGTMRATEFYSWLRYSYLAQPDLLVNLTGTFDGYYWTGPAQPQLPGQVDRLSLDMEAVLLGHGPINTAIGFHPQLVNDYEDHPTSKAFSFDGRVINTQRISPDVLLVYGFAVWNRVDLILIPEVGAVWTPNDRWEFRLLFPRSQFSYRLGEINGGQTWLTSVVEYVVQAYQVDIPDVDRRDRIQIQDWRASAGVRQDYDRISWTADVGVVFDRHVTFQETTPDFDLDPTALFRVGLWF